MGGNMRSNINKDELEERIYASEISWIDQEKRNSAVQNTVPLRNAVRTATNTIFVLIYVILFIVYGKIIQKQGVFSRFFNNWTGNSLRFVTHSTLSRYFGSIQKVSNMQIRSFILSLL